MLTTEQASALERRLARMERRQRRIEIGLAILLTTVLVGLLIDGNSAVFGWAIVAAVFILFAAVVRAVVRAGRDDGAN